MSSVTMGMLVPLMLLAVFLVPSSALLSRKEALCIHSIDSDLCLKILNADPRTRTEAGLLVNYTIPVLELASTNATATKAYIQSLLSNSTGGLKEKLSICSWSYTAVINCISSFGEELESHAFGSLQGIARLAQHDIGGCEYAFEGIESPLKQNNHNALVYMGILLSVANILWP